MPYGEDELQLVYRLYLARKKYAGNAPIDAMLDQVSTLLAELEIEDAAALLNSAAPAGDYDADGDVDAVDYLVWRNAFGTVDDPLRQRRRRKFRRQDRRGRLHRVARQSGGGKWRRFANRHTGAVNGSNADPGGGSYSFAGSPYCAASAENSIGRGTGQQSTVFEPPNGRRSFLTTCQKASYLNIKNRNELERGLLLHLESIGRLVWLQRPTSTGPLRAFELIQFIGRLPRSRTLHP